MGNRDLAEIKIGLTDVSSASCGKCNKAIPRHKLKDREGEHEYLDSNTGKQALGYKLEFICPDCSEVVLGAVVWEHEMVGKK